MNRHFHPFGSHEAEKRYQVREKPGRGRIRFLFCLDNKEKIGQARDSKGKVVHIAILKCDLF